MLFMKWGSIALVINIQSMSTMHQIDSSHLHTIFLFTNQEDEENITEFSINLKIFCV